MVAALGQGYPMLSFASGICPPQVSDVTQQQANVSGIVVDESGEPLIGVSVVVKGQKTGAVTDFNGKFTIKCNPSDVLTFSYVGYTSQDIQANKVRQVVLREDNALLNEVIVIGYGTTTRKSAVGAVEQVGEKAFADRPVLNATNALQGAAPSVIIQRRNLNPTEDNTTFNIRGYNSSTDNSPLFVIDGMVMDATAFNQLNPNDIENISILKDAGTAAIYGSRSAAGVVVVTTKSGKLNQTTQVKFSAALGWNKTDMIFHAVEGYQNALADNLRSTNIGKTPNYSQAQILDFYNHRSEERWAYDDIYKTTMQQNYNATISGGSAKTTYLISAGYFDVDNNYNTQRSSFGTQRYNFRTNISTELGRFKITAIMDYTRRNTLTPTGGNLDIDASRVPAYYTEKIIADDGRYLLTPTLSEQTSLGELNKGYNKYRSNYLTANVTGELKIVDGLKLRGVFGANIITENRNTHQRPQTYYRNESDTEPVPLKQSDNYVDSWSSNAYRLNTQILLDYQKNFGLHGVNGLFGFTNESYTRSGNSIRKSYTDELGNATSTTTGEVGNITGSTFIDDNSRTSINSLIGRFGYNWAERYYAEFSFRYDGSSKFGKDYRWGFFPSGSVAWRASEESWMKNYRQNVGDLKFRASYGVLGNQAVGNYDRFTKYSINPNGYVFQNGVASSAGFSYGLDNLTWERTKELNLALEASFFKNSLNIQFDYFFKTTTDILMQPIVASTFGTSMPRDNIGKMSNNGWEVNVNYRLKTGDFHHEFNLSLSDAKNKVKEFPGYESISGSDEMYRIIREGYAYNSYFGYEEEGIFQSWDEIANSALPVGAMSAQVSGNMGDISPGDIKYKDQNGDGVIDDKDRVIVGSPLPRYNFGFTYNLAWKNFDFSMLIQGVLKRDMFLRGEMVEPFHADYSKTIYKHQLDYWTPTNTGAKWPRLAEASSPSHANNWAQPGEHFILNAAYARLKNIAIGYTLPGKWTSKVGIEKARIYVNAQDLFTFTHNSFIDPESSEINSNMQSSGGSASGRQYLPSTYYGFGVDIQF